MNFDFNTVKNDNIVAFPVAANVSDVIIDKVEYVSDTSKAGNDYEGIQFIMKKQTSDGLAYLRDFIYPVDEENVYPRDGESREDAIARSHNDFLKRLLHYASKYGASKEDLAAATSFAEGENKTFANFADKYIKFFMSKLDNRRLYVKVMRNSKGYAVLPIFVPFLQEMSEGNCTLKYSNWEINKLKEIEQNINSTANDAVESVSIGSESDDDDFNSIEV